MAAAPQTPAFRSGTEVVRVDVSVLDADRHPIRGLRPEDFTVKVNGQVQRVVALTEIEVPPSTPPAAPWLRDTTPDVATNRVRDRRVWAIVMDDATVPPDIWVVNHAKDIARGVVERMGPGDVAAIIFTRDNSGSQEFTSDRKKLLAAIDEFSASAQGFVPRASPDAPTIHAPTIYPEMSVTVLRSTAKALSELPDRQKALVYVSTGVNSDVTQMMPALATLSGGSLDRLNGADLVNTGASALRLLAANNVPVYPFDPEGLPTNDRMVEASRMNGQQFLRALADSSGGRAAVNSNDATPALERMFAENASYYLLGFEVPPKWRTSEARLEIEVNQRGALVRSLHQVMPIVAAEKGAAPPPVAKALSSLLPVSDVPMTAAVAPFQKKGQDATVAVTLGVYGPVGAKAKDTADLIVTAFDADGRKGTTERTRADIVFRAGADAGAMTLFEVQSRIDLKPGRYQLRLAAHRSNTDESGSVFTDVEVPNFEKDDVSLSGVVLSMTPAPVSAPRGALAGLVPVVPTTVRDFSKGTAVDAFLRVHQGKGDVQPVTMSVKFIDTNNVTVMSRKEPIAATQFLASHAADYRLPLPISALAPGAYLMRIVAARGSRTASRDVLFVVR